MKLKRLISLVLTVLMITSLSSVCLTANAAEIETAETGALGSYYNVNYLEAKAYNGTDLGSTYTPAKTTWKVWSPEAKSVKLNLFATGSDLENGAANLGTHSLKLNSSTGVWSVELTGDYKNIYYTYTVETAKLGAMETYDIYAKACGVNGNRSMVVDLDATDPEGWENDQHVFQDQVTDEAIWEIHIADLTSNDNSGVSPEYQGKFLGFVEGGLTYNGKSTGVDYLVEQGIKVVHIQCPFDFASGDERNDESYNWGYDPKNYNVPEGLYSTNPYDGNVRITEFKQLIQALHDRGISVVMGVVYNHTFGSDKSPFTYTVPGYYYRMSSATQYINCTACGNTLATDKKMFKNYMMQSLKYWVEEYHVDGFRFDLMGAHDYQIMNEIRSMFDGMLGGEGKKIIMYGEPWTGTGDWSGLDAANQCTINNASKLKERIGCFNDATREAIQNWFKGDTAQTNMTKQGIVSKTKGGLVPNKSLTYFDCHDGVTWWDNIQATSKKYDSTSDADKIKLRTSMTYLFTSQGVPFMLAGTEFARTKYGNGNSYNLGDVNAFDWKRIETYATEVAYVKGLREIRHAFTPFRSSSTVVNPSYLTTGNNVIAYTLNNSKAGEWSKALVIMNNGSASSVTLPAGTWTVVADGTKAGLASLGTASGTYNVATNGSAILVQGETTAKSATYEKVTVKHVADGKTIKTSEALYAVGDTWRAVPDNYTMFNHNVESIEANAGTKLGNTYYGTVEAGKDVVVTINYKSFNTDGYVTIKYVDEKGEPISQDITFRMLDGEKFNLPFSNVSGYELVSTKYPANYKGTFDSSKPEVITFVYKQLQVESIDVYYYNANNWSQVGMYAYTDAEDKPLGAWGEKAQRMQKVTNLSELPKGETSTNNWYKHSITDDNSKLDYHITSCNVMFHNMGGGQQEPLNGEPGYVASGTMYVKNKVLSFNTDIVVSHIDAETGEKLAEDERQSLKSVSNAYTYTTKHKEGLGEPIVPTNATGAAIAGSICVVYLYSDKEEPTTTPTTAPTTAPTTPSETTATGPSEIPTTVTEPKTEVTTATTPGEFVKPLYLGDADLSEVVNIKDATVVQKHAALLLMLTGDGLTCADANGDENVNVKDATVIQKFLAKIETPYAVGKPIPGTGEFVTLPVPTNATTDAPVVTDPTDNSTTVEPTTAVKPTETPTTAPTVPKETDPYIPENQTITIYFANTYGWSSVYWHAWNDAGATNTPWPGDEMTYVDGNVYSATINAEFTGIIFNDGSGSDYAKTDNIDIAGDGQIYYDGSWTTYDPNGNYGGGSDNPDVPVPGEVRTVYFSNVNHWDAVYAYCWNDLGENNAQWPGVPMTLVEQDNGYGQQVYAYDVDPMFGYIIFSNGNGTQCADINLSEVSDNGFFLTGEIVNDKGHYGYDTYAR